MPRRLCIAIAAALAAMAGGAGPLSAAPQVLGIMAGDGPLPMVCDDAGCSAELSAFCLQQARPLPARGTAYRPADASRILLVITTAAGGTVRLPAGDDLAFASARGFTAVRVTLPAAARRALDAVAVAVEVGRGATLVPVPLAGDPDPQGEDEIALATGALRQAAAGHFDGDAAPAMAARLTSRLINALPEKGRSAYDRAPAATVWQDTIGAAPDGTSAGVVLARRLHDGCRGAVAEGYQFSLRRCLEKAHDGLIAGSNLRFWDATRGY